MEAVQDYRSPVYSSSDITPQQRLALLERPVKSSSDILSLVSPILQTVREGGDEGLRSLVVKFDRCTPATDKDFPLTLKAPFDDKLAKIDPKVKEAIDVAYHNIKTFHSAQMERESDPIRVETMPGVICSRFARPIGSVGLYVPGGTAVLPSTALMLGVPAQVAGCKTITLATPPRPDGSISPEIVYIAQLTGVSTLVKAGGAQAIASMAYGTETVPKADKIYGPGNQFVTAAKMSVAMDSGAKVAIDVPAGPSEVLIICDSTADPALIASDLLGQQEHGLDSQSVLVAIDFPTNMSSQSLELSRSKPRSSPGPKFSRNLYPNHLFSKSRTLRRPSSFQMTTLLSTYCCT